MSEQSNVHVVKSFFEAFCNNDMQGVRSVLAEDAIFHIPGNSALSGDYRGFDRIMGFFGKVRELSNGTFKPEVRKILSNGDKAFVLQHVTGAREGKTLDMDGAFVIHMEGGRWKELWAFHFDDDQADRFWS